MVPTFPDLVVATLLSIATFVVVRCWVKGIREINQHKAAHYHIVMNNAETARRYREHILANAEKAK